MDESPAPEDPYMRVYVAYLEGVAVSEGQALLGGGHQPIGYRPRVEGPVYGGSMARREFVAIYGREPQGEELGRIIKWARWQSGDRSYPSDDIPRPEPT